MMKTAGLKYIFYSCSLLLLIALVLLSRNAGITCDEVLHYGQSEAVFNYFATHGADQSALNTPATHLKYYGQAYDNIVTFVTKWFRIEDVYSFRHVMSALAGWLTLFITALFAVWLSGYRTGIIVLILFAVSPAFMGHAQNNLKDIPFALSYITGTFFIIRLFFSEEGFRFSHLSAVIVCIGFSISIRSGGLVLICYLFAFFALYLILNRFKTGSFDLSSNGWKLIIIILASASAFLLGILLWPWALQAPVRNVLESYRIMTHFPSTFRQIFEGQFLWSDMMPGYYLVKSMAITIPLVVSAGLLVFLVVMRKAFVSGKIVIYLLILFTILFPVAFVLFERSNLYSSWRQFLFVYPAVILLAATGFNYLFDVFRNKILRVIMSAVLVLLSIHPAKFIIKNPAYSYIYYNQLVGGLKGAYGNYETDYYYVSQTEASKWLLEYLGEKRTDSLIVAATAPVSWEFRNYPGIKTIYIRNEERSMYAWDYAIVANRYIIPAMLKGKLWPPANAIHIIYVGDVPVCAVLERKNKSDYQGYRSLEAGNYADAVNLFDKALKIDDKDEMIFYNFARALYNDGRHAEADSVLKAGLAVNPDSEPILMYLGNISAFNRDTLTAIDYYERVIRANRKYFEAYVRSAELLVKDDLSEARSKLRECLRINPGYKPAITTLADTYRETDPEIARRLDEIAGTIE